jgi:Fe-S-cluster containining protein
MAAAPEKENICLNCGLCCDGTLYSHVRLRKGDDGEKLRALGLDLAEDERGRFFAQPCAAFAGGCCTIYAGRPAICQKFRCKLRQRYDAGEVTADAAKTLIKSVQTFDAENAIRPGLAALAGHQNRSIDRLLGEAHLRIASAENPAELRRQYGDVLMRAMVLVSALEKDFFNREKPNV